MRLPEIRQALADRIGAVSGVNSAYDVPPNQLGTLPCGVVFHDPDATNDITMGDSEMWTHRLMVRLYIAPVKNIPNELAQADGFIEPFVAEIAGHYQLGVSGVYGAPVTGYRVGTAEYGGTAYVVAEWLVAVKAKQARSIAA